MKSAVYAQKRKAIMDLRNEALDGLGDPIDDVDANRRTSLVDRITSSTTQQLDVLAQDYFESFQASVEALRNAGVAVDAEELPAGEPQPEVSAEAPADAEPVESPVE